MGTMMYTAKDESSRETKMEISSTLETSIISPSTLMKRKR